MANGIDDRIGRRGPRRRWIALVGVIALSALAFLTLDAATATRIWSYRVIDDHRIVVQAIGGPGVWTRVTGVTETTTAVTVRLSAIQPPLPGASDDIIEFTIDLRDPIGVRQVIDGSSGLVTPRSSG
jgi:hypothetical protein